MMMFRKIVSKVKSRTRRQAALGLFLLISSASYTQPASFLSLDSCYAMAARNYPLIRQYGLVDKSRDFTISNANKAYLPQVSITGIGAYIISGLPTISLPNAPAAEKKDVQFIGIAQINQLIWDGGATHTQKEVAKAGAGVDKAALDVSMYEIRDRVNQLYFGILLIDEQMKILSILDENLKRSLNNVELSKDNGLAYQTDVDQVKTEQLNVEQRRIEFRYTRQGYVDMLGFMTGSTLPGTASLVNPVSLESYSSLTNIRPELNLFEKQQKAVEAAAGFDLVSVMPKFGLMGAGILIEPGITFATSTINTLALAGLSMSWSTGGLYKLGTNKKLDKLKLEKISNQKETFLFNTNLQLKQISSEIGKQKAILGNDDEIVALRGKIKNSYQVKYDNGMCSITDLINAINKESESVSTRSLHRIQMLMSVYNYKTKTGH